MTGAGTWIGWYKRVGSGRGSRNIPVILSHMVLQCFKTTIFPRGKKQTGTHIYISPARGLGLVLGLVGIKWFAVVWNLFRHISAIISYMVLQNFKTTIFARGKSPNRTPSHTYTYRAVHILAQIYTANHATFPIQMYAITV